jgi:methyltransferase (TIGR00027 family)
MLDWCWPNWWGAHVQGDGTPLVTARRVAAHRLAFERPSVPFGDPAADEALARDVAGGETGATGAMVTYLRGRTAFFDRVVVHAIERGVPQMVILGAGYDGRALRFGAPEVRWWEVDHPDTQRDKRSRLERLGVAADQVAFVPLDLRLGGLPDVLRRAGFDPDAPAQVLCEGVAVYLSPDVLERTLHGLRSLVTVGTRLAISLGVQFGSVDGGTRRRRFDAAVASVGEAALNHLTPDEGEAPLVRTRWRTAEVSDRARRAGFVVALPRWEPAGGPAPCPACRARVGSSKGCCTGRRPTS